jgi:hypothetical protein
MSIEAIGSRRVSGALRALAEYLDQGARVAEGVPPGQVVKLELDPPSTTPGPQVSDVVWEESESRIIERPPGQHTLHVVVSGENLEDVEMFKLIDARSATTYVEADLITEKKEKKCKAQFTLKFPNSSAVAYHPYIITGSGQTMSRQTLTVTVTEDLGLQLGELFPNVLYSYGKEQEQDALLVVLRGDPSTFSVVNTQGNVQKEWKITKTSKHEIQISNLPVPRADVERMYKIDAPGQLLFLKIKMPGMQLGAEHRVYYLNAKDGLGAEDKVAFFVAAG